MESKQKYDKLSKQALKCMYTAECIGTLVELVIVAALNWFWLIPKDIEIGKIISIIFIMYSIIAMFITPWFRFHRYRYAINEECIDIKEGYLFVKRNIVPIERLHKLETLKGPIDQIFHVAKVKVTTAGGDVTIRFLDEEKAEKIAESLRNRINEIVKEQREQDGE
ncbi:PH domain-containing protein [Erysipelotrichaceae bacterium HCN-30851]